MKRGLTVNDMLKELMHKTIDRALSVYHADEVECYYTNIQSSKFSLKKRDLEDRSFSQTRGLGLRIIKDKKLGYSHGTNFTEKGIDELIQNTLNNHHYQEKEYDISFHKDKSNYTENHIETDFNQIGFEEKFNLALSLEEKVRSGHSAITCVENTSYFEAVSESFLYNSHDYQASKYHSVASLSAMALSKEGEQEESGGAGLSVKNYHNFDLDYIAKEAIFDATKLLGAKKISSYKGMVLLSRDMAKIILSLLASSFKGSTVYKKKSLFPTIGEEVAPHFFSLVDNPLLKEGLGHYGIDDEGTHAQKTYLIENGIVKQHLYDRYYGHLMNLQSTGNGTRGTYMSTPSISYSNYYLEKGKHSFQDLLTLMNKGVYVTDILGAHTANTITGEFSFGISGIVVEDGKLSYPFRGATLSGNLKQVLQNIVGLGDDLDLRETTGAPSVLIDKLSVAG